MTDQTQPFLETVRNFFLQYGFKNKYWLAYSGGLDSHVLLSLCHTLTKTLPIQLSVIHVNHGLSSNAEAWSAHCAMTCRAYQLDYIERRIEANLISAGNMEEKARDARYAIFQEYVQAGDILLTAHQQNDQAETLLLQLFRGAGVKGLAAMPIIKSFAQGLHARPLLSFSRDDLKQYAIGNHLHWIEDESNQNVNFTRNFIRHHILAKYETQGTNVIQTIARSAAHCAESQILLDDFAKSLHEKVQGSKPDTLSVTKLLQLSAPQQRLMLRYWIELMGYPLPDAKKLYAIQNNVLTAAWDTNPFIRWHSVELRRFQDQLYLMHTLPALPKPSSSDWDLMQTLHLPDSGTLHAIERQGSGLKQGITQVSVRFRQGGEKIYLPGRGHHTLKNLFQEWSVEPWERYLIPLIFVEEKLIAVVGYFIHEEFSAKQNELGKVLVWDKGR